MNSTFNTTVELIESHEHIGGLPYILPYLGIYIPYSLLAFVGTVIGIIGNLI
jgi:hypothetical protein